MARDLTTITVDSGNKKTVLPTAAVNGLTTGVMGLPGSPVGNKYANMPSTNTQQNAVVNAVNQYNQNPSAPYSNDYTERLT